MLVTNHCSESRQTLFKRHESFQDVLCCHDYSERVVASFAHQIKSEYYGENIFVSIEGIALENFSGLPKTGINVSTKTFPRHAVFYSFLLDDSKQDSSTTTKHIKRLIVIIKETIIDVTINYNMEE